MFPAQIPRINPDDFSRCEEQRQMTDHERSRSPIQKTDAAIKEYIDHAFWKDDVLRAIEYSEIGVHVKNGVVYLNGHITSNTSQRRIRIAIRAIPGILGIKDWTPPYPYCSDEVLFPIEFQNVDLPIVYEPDPFPFAVISEGTSLGEQLLANDSLGR